MLGLDERLGFDVILFSRKLMLPGEGLMLVGEELVFPVEEFLFPGEDFSFLVFEEVLEFVEIIFVGVEFFKFVM